MTAINNPFHSRVLEAERKVAEAKHQAFIYDWLVAHEIMDKYAFTIVNSADWDAVLECGEFYDSEKYEFQRMVNDMRKEITSISGQIILAAI